MNSCSSEAGRGGRRKKRNKIGWGEAPERLCDLCGGLDFRRKERAAGQIDAPSRCPALDHGSARLSSQQYDWAREKSAALLSRSVIREPRPTNPFAPFVPFCGPTVPH